MFGAIDLCLERSRIDNTIAGKASMLMEIGTSSHGVENNKRTPESINKNLGKLLSMELFI